MEIALEIRAQLQMALHHKADPFFERLKKKFFHPSERMKTFYCLVVVGLCCFLYSWIKNQLTVPLGGDYTLQEMTFLYNGYDDWHHFFETGDFPFWDRSAFLGIDNIGGNSFYYLFDPFFLIMLYVATGRVSYVVVSLLLLAVGGVAQVAVLGGDIKEYQILLDMDRMRRYGVTTDEVLAATEDMNRNASGGVLYEYSNEYIIRGMASTTAVDEIALAVVKTAADGRPITLRDIAEVRTGPQEPRTGTASIEGKPGVLLTVTKQPKVSTNDLTDADY